MKINKGLAILIATIIILCFVLFTLLLIFNNNRKPALNELVYENIKKETYIFIGDTGSGNQDQFKVSTSIEKYCETENCKSVFIAGDVIYNNGVSNVDDPQFISKFEEPYKNIDLPFNIAFGNHDYHGCTSCYLEYSKKSLKWRMPDYYYKINSDGVDFFVIDTQNLNETQTNWLNNELVQSTAKFKIVVGHKPIITYGKTHANDNWSDAVLLKNIICNNADLYISGHSHLLEHNSIDNCEVQQIVSGGGGIEKYSVVENSKNIFYLADFGFVSLIIGKNNIDIEFIDSNATKVYTFSIK